MTEESKERNAVDLGPCCICGGGDGFTSGLLPLEFKTPIPSTGWGCSVCKLPPDGLLVVICESCMSAKEAQGPDGLADFVTEDFKTAVLGFAINRDRFDLRGFPLSPFAHDDAAHASKHVILIKKKYERTDAGHRGSQHGKA